MPRSAEGNLIVLPCRVRLQVASDPGCREKLPFSGLAGGALHRQAPTLNSFPAFTPQMTIAGSWDPGPYG